MSKIALNNIVYRLILANIGEFTQAELDLIEAELVSAISRRDDTVVDGHTLAEVLFAINRHHNLDVVSKLTWVPGASLQP